MAAALGLALLLGAGVAAPAAVGGPDEPQPGPPTEWVWDSGRRHWGLWRWDASGTGWVLIRAQQSAPAGQAPVQEWVWDARAGQWGLWRWDHRAVRWLLTETRRQNPPGQAQPGTPAVLSRAAVVSARGRSLLLGGRPFRYVGVNAYGLTGRETGRPYSAQQLQTLFRALPPGTLVRTWAWSTDPPEALGPVVSAAEETGQRLIITLTEGAGHDDRPLKDQDWFAREFQSDAIPWVDQVVGRYKASPAIGIWEVMNEPGWRTAGAVDGAAMHRFVTTMARRIKTLDPAHLVGTGAMDCTNAPSWAEGDTCARINADPAVDVMSVHDYADAYEGGLLVSANFESKLARVAAIAKPIVVGEVGLAGGADGGCRSLTQRAELFRRKFDAYFARGVAGLNVWNVTASPRGCRDSEKYDIGFDDPVLDLLRAYRPPAPG